MRDFEDSRGAVFFEYAIVASIISIAAIVSLVAIGLSLRGRFSDPDLIGALN